MLLACSIRAKSCLFKEYGGGMCPLGRLDQSQIRSKAPLFIMMIGVDAFQLRSASLQLF